MDMNDRLTKIISESTPKKKKRMFGIFFYITIILVVIMAALSVYSFKKTEKELGFTSSNQSILEIFRQNFKEFIF